MADSTYYITSFLTIAFTFISIVIYYIIKKHPPIDSPISFTLGLYFIYFFISPVVDIISKTTSMAGLSLLPYYPITEFVFLCGLLSLLIFYELTSFSISNLSISLKPKYLLINAIIWEVIGLFGYFLWTRKLGVPFFVINPLKLTNYYLFLGETSKKASGYLALSLLFLIPSSLMLLELWLRKILKNVPLLILIINFILFITRGVRYMVLIYGGSLIFYYLKRTKKKLKKIHLFSIFAFALLLFSVIAYLRGMPSLSHINFNSKFILAFFVSSFSLFKPTTAIIRYIPHFHPFLLGESFFYLFLYPIPRVIWPQKPYPIFLKIIWKTTGGRFLGYAVPNIGEYYANFGIPGVIVFMAILGIFFKLVYNTYKRHMRNEFITMSYSILFFYIFQIISRGYFPQVFVQGVYLFLPLISLYILNARKN